MTQKILAITALLITSSAFAQSTEHAILPEQCRADVRLWITQDKAAYIEDLSYAELNRRSREMYDCQSIDSEAAEKDFIDYRLMLDSYQSNIAKRALSFIERHGFTQQFLKEDAAGAR